MKKMVLVVVGIVLLIGAGLLIGREKAQKAQEEAIGITNVSQAARLPSGKKGSADEF